MHTITETNKLPDYVVQARSTASFKINVI